MDNNNTQNSDLTETKKKQDVNPREKIAQIITRWVPIATVILAIGAIVLAFYLIKCEDDTDGAIEVLKYTFASLVPLWATWLGTVLAYYFSKENFQAANESVSKLVSQVTSVKEKLQSIKATSVMIPLLKMVRKNCTTTQEINNFTIKEALEELKIKKRNRLPILENNILKYIIHASVFDRFVRNQIVAGKSFNDLTIADMAKSTDEIVKNSLEKGAAFIGIEANLLEAKKIMDDNTFCNDVFLTKTGSPTEEVLGWITDKTINENAKV
jgi:hypothetical protein